MRPQIDQAGFGWIVIAGVRYEYDVVIQLDGRIRRRKKRLSKERYGTSHIISLEEASDVYEEGCETLLIGSGAFGRVRLSEEAESYFGGRGVTVKAMPTGEALESWNLLEGAVVGLFHVTC